MNFLTKVEHIPDHLIQRHCKSTYDIQGSIVIMEALQQRHDNSSMGRPMYYNEWWGTYNRPVLEKKINKNITIMVIRTVEAKLHLNPLVAENERAYNTGQGEPKVRKERHQISGATKGYILNRSENASKALTRSRTNIWELETSTVSARNYFVSKTPLKGNKWPQQREKKESQDIEII